MRAYWRLASRPLRLVTSIRRLRRTRFWLEMKRKRKKLSRRQRSRATRSQMFLQRNVSAILFRPSSPLNCNKRLRANSASQWRRLWCWRRSFTKALSLARRARSVWSPTCARIQRASRRLHWMRCAILLARSTARTIYRKRPSIIARRRARRTRTRPFARRMLRARPTHSHTI